MERPVVRGRNVCLAAALLCVLAPVSESRRGAGHDWALDKDGDFADLVDTECAGIPRVNYRRLSNADFKRQFLDPTKPVLLTGAQESWAARKRWKRRSFLKKFGNIKVEVGNASDIVLFASGWHSHLAPMKSLEDFINGFGGEGGELDKSFVFQAIGKANSLQQDFDTPNTLLPFFQLERPSHAPKMWNMVSLGEHGAGLPFHDHGDSWLGLVHGSKHWFLYAPGTAPNVQMDVLSGVQYWARNVLPTLNGNKPIQCTQKAGEILYVPQGWIHATLNIGDAVAVGGQIEWLSVQRESSGRYALAQQTNDYHGHKNVAIATGWDIQASPDATKRIKHLREGFSAGVGVEWRGAAMMPLMWDLQPIPGLQRDKATILQKVKVAAEHFEAALALRPNNFPLYLMICDLYISTGDTSIVTLDAVLKYSEQLAKLALKMNGSVVMAVDTISAEALASASDYVMTAVHMSQVAGDWERVMRGLEVHSLLHPGDAATQAGIDLVREHLKDFEAL
eukprot:COSAG05_NODE_1988_length_3739_cov_33.369505_2_plen_507_part_00